MYLINCDYLFGLIKAGYGDIVPGTYSTLETIYASATMFFLYINCYKQ